MKCYTKIEYISSPNNKCIIIGEERIESKSRTYYTFDMMKDFTEWYDNKNIKLCHEIFSKNRKVKPFFDIDFNLKRGDEDGLQYVKIINNRYKIYMLMKGYKLSDPCIATSPIRYNKKLEMYRYSYHVTYPNLHFKNIDMQRYVVKDFIEMNPDLDKFVDTNPYFVNKSLRLLLSGKSFDLTKVKTQVTNADPCNFIVSYINKDSQLLNIDIVLPIIKKKTIIIDCDVEYIKQLLLCYNIKRCNDHWSWIAVGFALYSLGNDDYLDIWTMWSKQSNKYKRGCCEYQWKFMKDIDNGYTIRSLKYWAKLDNPEQYYKILKNSIIEII